MSRTERLCTIERLLRERRAVSLGEFLEQLGISHATFKRDMEYLRERLNAPIIWDRSVGGYRFDATNGTMPTYELPGLWFTASELYALLAAHKLLSEIEPGVLAPHIAPLRARLETALAASGHSVLDIAQRVRLLSMGKRSVEPRFFAAVSAALLERKRIEIEATNRERDEINHRTLSPLRLIHYRDNWYLDAWCHWREARRRFSLDTFMQVTILPEPAFEFDPDQLNAAAYGIFSGEPRDWAVLRFSAERARWVRAECWHENQRAETLSDGSYRLHVPYADPRELIMDILRHGRHVEVEAPESLRQRVAEEVAALSEIYR